MLKPPARSAQRAGHAGDDQLLSGLRQTQTRQQRGAAGALAQFLLDRAVLEEGQKIVPESYSNADISRFLGIHPVTAAKILKELKSQGLITRSKSGIIILDEPLLQQYADGEKKLVYHIPQMTHHRLKPPKYLDGYFARLFLSATIVQTNTQKV